MSMVFQKKNKLGAKRIYTQPVDSKVIAFRGRIGQIEKLKTVPDWQERLRDYVDQLIEEVKAGKIEEQRVEVGKN